MSTIRPKHPRLRLPPESYKRRHPGDGLAIISAMRSAHTDAVRFVLTGYPAFESALEAIRGALHDYSIKPTETELLVEKIRSKPTKRSPAQAFSASGSRM